MTQRTFPLAFPVDPETGRAAPGAVPRRQLDIEEAIAEAPSGAPGTTDKEEPKP